MPPSYLVNLYYNDFTENARELSAKNVKMKMKKTNEKQDTSSALYIKYVLKQKSESVHGSPEFHNPAGLHP